MEKLGKAGKTLIIIGAIIFAAIAYVISAGLYSEDGNAVTIIPFFENLKTLLSKPSLLFNAKYINGNLIISLFVVEMLYALVIVYWRFGPNKYMKGKEYGQAEWVDASVINKKIASFNPEDRYKSFYVKEKKHKKIIRKVFERKKDYIK